MTEHAQITLDPTERRELGAIGSRAFVVGGLIGVVALAASIVLGFARGAWEQFLFAYLVNFAFFLSISLGALFFVILQHLTRAGWSVSVRRIAELLAGNVWLMLVLLIPILLGMGKLYHWMHPDPNDTILANKQAYLNLPFFVGRVVAYFLIWILLARYYLRRSVSQDDSGDVALSTRMQRTSGVAMILFGLTLTFAAFDLLMSLDPHWFSTIYGVYYFSGSAVAFFAVMVCLCVWLKRRGILTASITIEHYHDLGKFLFAFVFFWGYIAFSQYMLQWYGNLPEETGWFYRRGAATGVSWQEQLAVVEQMYQVDKGYPIRLWGIGGLVLLLVHFVIPFVGLMSRQVKRRLGSLSFWAVWMLAGHWIDLCWLVLPESGRALGWLDAVLLATTWLGIGGLFVAGLAKLAAGRQLMPVRDPYLAETLAFENM